MSIDCGRNQEKRSVRTLIAIATLAPIVFGGARQPHGEVLSSSSSCASWPSCFRQQKSAAHIKVLSDLFSLFLLNSIDIKVLQTFSPHSQAPSCKSCTSWPSCFRQQKKRAGRNKTPRAQSMQGAVKNRAYAVYFACFTSPNVFNARCAGETGPRNRRVTNVSALPPNETSSI